MVSPPPAGAVRITVVTSPACHFCGDADRVLAELASTFAVEVEHVDSGTAEGRALVAVHRPALAPLVLVDGEYFSSGRLPRRKLLRLLAVRTARVAGAPVTTAGRGGR